ncbi:MAG: hypothetical protein WD154_06525 [Nitrosopumilaceae archaeon]
MTKEGISLKYDPSYLDGFNPSKFDDELFGLKKSNYIYVHPLSLPHQPIWCLTPEGILYVKKNFADPIRGFIQRPDFDKNLEDIPAQYRTHLSALRDISKADSSNEKVNDKILSYAVKNIPKWIDLITSVINLVSKL